MKENISGWTLFTLRGVAVKLHASLLFLIFYVVLIAMIQFPVVVQLSHIEQNEITGTPFVWAVIFSMALLVSIFVHEFGHILVAQAKGYRVKSITLMMLGGATQMEKPPEEPATEFKVAIMGPLVSLAIAGILFWIRSLSLSPNLDFFCFWVGQTNLVLGIFNLLPAFPMDGGRVLRALLVTKQGLLRGTQTAVQISQIFVWIFAIMGFLQFNFILLLIAFFIYGAAKSEFFILLGQTLLKGMKVKDLMVILPSISENSTISDAVAKMVETKSLLLPVTREAGLPFLLTADFLKRIPKTSWDTLLIKNIKADFPNAIGPDQPLEDTLLLALKTIIGGVPVVENNQLVGVLRTSDLFEAIVLRQLIVKQPEIKPWSLRIHHAHPR